MNSNFKLTMLTIAPTAKIRTFRCFNSVHLFFIKFSLVKKGDRSSSLMESVNGVWLKCYKRIDWLTFNLLNFINGIINLPFLDCAISFLGISR